MIRSHRNELSAELESMPGQLPEAATILVDSGYENMDQMAEIEQAGITVYCSMGQQRKYYQPRYDFKPPKQKKAAPIKEKRRLAIAERMASEESREI